MSKSKTKNENKTEKALAAEKEQFSKQQVSPWLNLSYVDKTGFCVNILFIHKFLACYGV